MPLKLNKPAGPSTKEITLPSEGYSYPQAELKGGKIVVRAFDFDTESLMYGTSDSSAKQFARLCTLLSRITVWPPGFRTQDLLEGDSAFIVMAARSLTYPEQKYDFETACESVSLASYGSSVVNVESTAITAVCAACAAPEASIAKTSALLVTSERRRNG